MGDKSASVAVIGLGALGLVTVKNLLEEGFDVTGYDRNGYVGGLWHYTDEDKTSVLPTTIINISTQRGCYTDYPFPKDSPSHHTSKGVELYLESYADDFNLQPHLRLSTSVKKVSRASDGKRWVVEFEGPNAAEPEVFDKVVVATGINSRPKIPVIKGIEKFGGQTLHSQAFKRPEKFKGRKVLVVGLGNTGADTATNLVGHAQQIYVSHRDGAILMPRRVKGRPNDHSLTLRLDAVRRVMETVAPRLSEQLFHKFMQKIQNTAFNIRPEWGLSPAPLIKHAVPVITDTLVDALEAGHVLSVPGVQEVTGADEVLLTDGTRINVDTIIFCTGYTTDFDFVEAAYDPTKTSTPLWKQLPGSNGRPLPRLYRNIFSVKEPESLAFMGCIAIPAPAFLMYDLAAMTITQTWKGKSPLPSQTEIEAQADEHEKFVCNIASEGNAHPGAVDQYVWLRWAHDTAGTGLNEYLGWTWRGIGFWLREYRFCNLVMGGIYSPHILRLFETGKRKAWAGARDEIERVNAASKNA